MLFTAIVAALAGISQSSQDLAHDNIWLPEQIGSVREAFVAQARAAGRSDNGILSAWLRYQDELIRTELEGRRPEADALLAIETGNVSLAHYRAHYATPVVVGVSCTDRFEVTDWASRRAFGWSHTELGLDYSPGLAELQRAYIRRFNTALLTADEHPWSGICEVSTDSSQFYADTSERRQFEAEVRRLHTSVPD
jgi:hypothetical protein